MILLLGACTAKDTATSVPETKISMEAIKADFETLTKTIETKVPNPFLTSDKNRYDSVKLEISKAITQDMSVHEVFRLFYPMIKVLNDINYALYLPDSISNDSFIRYFPIQVLIDSGIVYVNETDSPLSKGQVIKSINGLATDSILQRMNIGMRLSDLELRYRYAYLSTVFSRKLYDICGFTQVFDVEIQDSVYKIAGEPLNKIINTQPLIQFDKKSDSVAYLKINSFNWGESSEADSIRVVLRNIFQELNNLQIPKLILDIRGVLNGNPAAVTEVLDYFLRTPYSLNSQTSFYINKELKTTDLPMHQPDMNKAAYGGKVVLISDILSSGSAHMMQVAFQYYAIGRTIGEPSIFGLLVTGQQQHQLLRHSGLEFYYPSANYRLPGYNDTALQQTYVPDIILHPLKTHYFSDKDIMIDAAIKVLNTDE